MENVALFNRLVQDYADTSIEMAEAARKLAEARGELYLTKRIKAEAESAVELYRARLVLREMGKDGCINGKNAETRQLQITDFLARCEVEDKALVELRQKLVEAEVAMNEATIQHDNFLDRLTVARNKARMIAGLGQAMGA